MTRAILMSDKNDNLADMAGACCVPVLSADVLVNSHPSIGPLHTDIAPNDHASLSDKRSTKPEKTAAQIAVQNMKQLDQELAKLGFMIVPMEPTAAMVQASMNTINHNTHTRMTKREKHKIRLSAAFAAHLVQRKVKLP